MLLRQSGEPSIPDCRWSFRFDRERSLRSVEEEAGYVDIQPTEQPDRFDVRLARYRAARAARHPALAQRALELLRLPVADAASARQQSEVFAEMSGTGLALDESQRLELARRWLSLGELTGAETLLEEAGGAASEAQAQLWLQLALRHRDRDARPAQERALRRLLERHPELPQAAKARFLLENPA